MWLGLQSADRYLQSCSKLLRFLYDGFSFIILTYLPHIHNEAWSLV